MNRTVISGILQSGRPQQWLKNLSLYAPLIFSGFLFFQPADGPPYFWTVTQAFIAFCFVTSAVYIFNDIRDFENDSKHPFKSKRPIASQQVSIRQAWLGMSVFLLLGALAMLTLPIFYKLLVLGYLVMQWAYSTKLKHVSIFDISTIATGFLIRVYAGAVVVNLHMNVWFLLTVISASLFLAVGKRQSERTLLTKVSEQDLGSTRKTLKRYSQRLLDQYTGMFANATWLTYALFAFQYEYVTPDSNLNRYYALLPRTWRSEKLLMLSLPFVIFGVMRYLQLVYEDNKGESPTQVLVRDKILLTTVLLFGLTILVVLYGLA